MNFTPSDSPCVNLHNSMHNIYYTTILDVIIQCELGREPGGQTSLPDNNLVLVSVNDINSFMTILIIIIFSFESNQINLDLLSNEWMMQTFCKYLRFAA